MDDLETLYSDCLSTNELIRCIKDMETTIEQARNVSVPENDLEKYRNLTERLENELVRLIIIQLN